MRDVIVANVALILRLCFCGGAGGMSRPLVYGADHARAVVDAAIADYLDLFGGDEH